MGQVGRRSQAAQKQAVLAKILRNPTYMPESKLYQLLKRHLNRLSLPVLFALDTIIEQKKEG
jgi:hypothetical protein